MNKEEILKMSREENEGRHDECEMMAYGTAGLFGHGFDTVIISLQANYFFISQKSDWLAGLYILQCKAVAVLYCIKS